MSTEENKALVRRDVEAWNRGNLTEYFAHLDEVCAPDFIYHTLNPSVPGGICSRVDYKQYCADFLAALPGHYTIEDLIAEGEKVVARYTYRGIHQGQWRGAVPTDKAVTFTGTVIYRIVDGKVMEIWDNPDQLGMLRQLGFISQQG